MITLSLLATLLQASNLWSISKGQLPYKRLALTYLLYGWVELWLALRDPEQLAILLFVVLDAWCFLMALKGWYNARLDVRDDH